MICVVDCKIYKFIHSCPFSYMLELIQIMWMINIINITQTVVINERWVHGIEKKVQFSQMI